MSDVPDDTKPLYKQHRESALEELLLKGVRDPGHCTILRKCCLSFEGCAIGDCTPLLSLIFCIAALGLEILRQA